MDYITNCLEKFKALPSNVKEDFGNIKVVERIIALEGKYNLGLDFILVLIAIGELGIDDIKDYLIEKYGLESELAEEIEQGLNIIIFPILEKLEIGEETGQTEFDLEREYVLILNQFKENLISTLYKDQNYLNLLNKKIIYIISKKENYKMELKNALLANREKLTEKNITIEEKVQEPTVNNWLMDFIKKNSSGFFTNVTLAQYMSDSRNTVKLNDVEKDKVKKILRLYRNLGFFPESMEGVEFNDWEIIPVKKEAKTVSSPAKAMIKKSPSSDKPNEEEESGGHNHLKDIFSEKNSDQISVKSPIKERIETPTAVLPEKDAPPKRNYPPVPKTLPTAKTMDGASSGRPAPPPVRPPARPPKPETKPKDPAKEQRLMELYHEARNYPEGSIQRRAVEEEIGRIKKSK